MQETELPLVTIVTPCLDQGQFLGDAIASVLAQDYPLIEYFVLDGGSIDGSFEVIRRYESRIDGWASEADEGPFAAISKGFAWGTGELLAWLNADDVLLPGAVSRAVRFLLGHPDVGGVFGHRLWLDPLGRVYDVEVAPRQTTSFLFRALLSLPQETVFFRRAVYESIEHPSGDALAFDFELFLRMHLAGAQFKRLDHFMGGYRFHDRSIFSTRPRELEQDGASVRDSLMGTGGVTSVKNHFHEIVLRRITWRARKLWWLTQFFLRPRAWSTREARALLWKSLRLLAGTSSPQRHRLVSGNLSVDEAISLLYPAPLEDISWSWAEDLSEVG